LVRAVGEFVALSYILPKKLNGGAYCHVSELALQVIGHRAAGYPMKDTVRA
jgi:hypothetical protein